MTGPFAHAGRRGQGKLGNELLGECFACSRHRTPGRGRRLRAWGDPLPGMRSKPADTGRVFVDVRLGRSICRTIEGGERLECGSCYARLERDFRHGFSNFGIGELSFKGWRARLRGVDDMEQKFDMYHAGSAAHSLFGLSWTDD